MLCEKCGKEYDESLGKCPYCEPEKFEQPQYAQEEKAEQPKQEAPKAEQQSSMQGSDNSDAEKYRGFSIASMVCGILSLILIWIPLLCIILGVLGIVFGVICKKNMPADARGMATAGFVCGIISISLLLVVTLCLVAVVGVAFTAIGGMIPYMPFQEMADRP